MHKGLLMFLVLWLSGCAVGNKYQYQTSSIALPVRTDSGTTVILTVEDGRPYVLSGEKPASFIGLQRGGFGNPFDVSTATGRSMTEDMAEAIETSLVDAGYKVVNAMGEANLEKLVKRAVEDGASRILLLKVRDWKSDIYLAITLHCDLELRIYDAQGVQLAENEMRFVEEVGGGLIGDSANSQFMSDEFSKRIGYLFNRKSIRDSLQ